MSDLIARQTYLDKLEGYLDSPLIKVLTGMRRCGKSALLRSLAERLADKGVGQDQIWLVNFESLANEHLIDSQALYQEGINRAARVDGKIYILLDEIQMVPGWESVVNSFRVDLNCDIVITGSNASLLSGELATLLSGRYVEIRVYPLSLSEYREFSLAHWLQSSTEIVNGQLWPRIGRDPIPISEFDEWWQRDNTPTDSFTEYLRFGGLPGIHELRDDSEIREGYLRDILNSVIMKDVVQRFAIRDVDLLDRVLNFVMTNLGQVFSAKSIADFFKSQHRGVGVETIYNYLDYLQQAFIIHKVARYDLKGKRVLETQEKYFLEDPGLATARLGYRPNEISGLLENIVFSELLRRGYEVHVGKQGKAEVDFVADRGTERLYLQVCYLLASDDVIAREFTPLTRIRDNFRKIVLSLDEFGSYTRDGIERHHLRDWLLNPSL